MRLMAIRQALLEPLALSVSGRERMFNGWAAASEEKTEEACTRRAGADDGFTASHCGLSGTGS